MLFDIVAVLDRVAISGECLLFRLGECFFILRSALHSYIKSGREYLICSIDVMITSPFSAMSSLSITPYLSSIPVPLVGELSIIPTVLDTSISLVALLNY